MRLELLPTLTEAERDHILTAVPALALKAPVLAAAYGGDGATAIFRPGAA